SLAFPPEAHHRCAVRSCYRHGTAQPTSGQRSRPIGNGSQIFARGRTAMKRIPVLIAVIAAMCLLSQTAAADAANGERLARQWCANCHVIDGSGPSATLPQGPPSFRVAAGHLNPGELRAFLSHPHGAMPDLTLARSEIDDLIAYIVSLH